MSNKTKIIISVFCFLIGWAIMTFIVFKFGKMKTNHEKQIIFLKKQYKFQNPKDWNNENLTREQHQFYQTLQYERAE